MQFPIIPLSALDLSLLFSNSWLITFSDLDLNSDPRNTFDIPWPLLTKAFISQHP